MRVKIMGNIIEKSKKHKTNYKHETYSMLLNNIEYDKAELIHTNKKMFRLFSFTNIYLNKDNFHFYFCGEDDLTNDLVQRLSFNQLIKVDDMILKITKINTLPELEKKEKYKFKSDIIVNISKNNKCELTNDFDFLCERVNKLAKDKYKSIYNKELNEDIKVEIVSAEKIYNKYKNHHLCSWRSKFIITGSYELINLIYNVGIGENTASGHGFMWEV